jgi:hypothetical protein
MPQHQEGWIGSEYGWMPSTSWILQSVQQWTLLFFKSGEFYHNSMSIFQGFYLAIEKLLQNVGHIS